MAADLMLEPYAAHQHWVFEPGDVPPEKLVAEYMERIASCCKQSGTCVLGHIKALALFPGGEYLRASIVSPDLPAEAQGAVPPGCTELDLDVNVIVYGLEREKTARIVREAAAGLAARWDGKVKIDIKEEHHE